MIDIQGDDFVRIRLIHAVRIPGYFSAAGENVVCSSTGVTIGAGGEVRVFVPYLNIAAIEIAAHGIQPKGGK